MSEITKHFVVGGQNEEEIKKIILHTYNALEEKGYNPLNQIVGYILSDDPTYITTNQNARNMIRRVDRYELMRILLKEYLEKGNT